MKTCLVVDDMEIRHEGFRKILGGKVNLLRADNYTEAMSQFREIGMFEEDKRIDVIFLDHDIECGWDKRDVIHFVNWMMRHDWAKAKLREWNTLFFIHSHNPVGAENMRKVLADNGFPVKVKPFEVK
jgi:hypothetical protein